MLNKTAIFIYFMTLGSSIANIIANWSIMPIDVQILMVGMPIIGFWPSFSRKFNKIVQGSVGCVCMLWIVFRMLVPVGIYDQWGYYVLLVCGVSTVYLSEVMIITDIVCVSLFFGLNYVIHYDYIMEHEAEASISSLATFPFVILVLAILWLTVRRSKAKVRDVQYRNHNFNQMTKLLNIKKEETEAIAKSKIDFLANTSHEIRTPMNAIIGMSELAIREEPKPEVEEYLNNIQSAARSLLAIINDVLDFSKIESHKIELFEAKYSIVTVINEVCSIVSSRIDQTAVQLIVEIDPSIPGVLYGDELRIRQIILNLAVNAAKFTTRGSITLKLSFKNINENRIQLRVSVKDTGIGIRRRDLERLFKAFEQVHVKSANNTEGTGLGLVISRNLVELMGGSITVNSTFGIGSEFAFEIPQKVIERSFCMSIKGVERFRTAVLMTNQPAEAQIEKILSQFNLEHTVFDSYEEWEQQKDKFTHVILTYDFYEQHTAVFNDFSGEKCVGVVSEYNIHTPLWHEVRRLASPLTPMLIAKLYENSSTGDEEKDVLTAPEARVLIVDDNKTNLVVASSLMKPYGMTIDTAESGAKAINLIGENDYDIVFMDHMMPEMDGIEATNIIRSGNGKKSMVPIVALTANADIGASNMFFAAGMNGFLAKPIDANELNAVLEKHLPNSKKVYGGVTKAAEEESGEKASAVIVERLREEIEELDVSFGLSQCLQDSDLYLEILDTAIHSSTFDELKKSFEKEDYENYTIYVHGLKGSARNIGVGVLGDLAFELELAGKRGDVEYIKANHYQFVEEYSAFTKRIEMIVGEDDSGKPAVEKKKASLADEKWEFEDLKEACGDFDYSWATNILEAIADKSFGDEADELIVKIAEDIDAFEFDSAAEKIDTLLGME